MVAVALELTGLFAETVDLVDPLPSSTPSVVIGYGLRVRTDIDSIQHHSTRSMQH